MATFVPALKKTLTHEGGYVNNAEDSGGETYYGISRKNYPNWAGWAPIDIEIDPPYSLLEDFYRREFWDALHLDKVSDQSIAERLFDLAVNMGRKTPVYFIQNILNLLSNDGSVIAVDGVLGNATVTALNECIKLRGAKQFLVFLKGYAFKHYIGIVNNRPKDKVFLWGWINRLYDEELQ